MGRPTFLWLLPLATLAAYASSLAGFVLARYFSDEDVAVLFREIVFTLTRLMGE